ncbi:MAG TPA: plastocyanin/azurin family copper-binding protein [Stellaceae bacterium]|nr:plastocyanin/azurin family copper-binding protein [Stellaceae bacterium]
MNRSPRLLAVLAAYLALAALALAAEIHEVVQQGRAFQTKQIEIEHGEIIQFVNRDPFAHQIYVDSKSFEFESSLQPPDQIVSVRFTVAGHFQVMCHVHPTMRLDVTVK